jgi:hypothetical protein
MDEAGGGTVTRVLIAPVDAVIFLRLRPDAKTELPAASTATPFAYTGPAVAGPPSAANPLSPPAMVLITPALFTLRIRAF